MWLSRRRDASLRARPSRPARGPRPAKVGKHSTVNRFRADCLRELKKINRAWPNLHYATVTGGLVLSPSPPRIQPAQLQLIGE